ncbi:MAG: response regulator [Bacteriovoracaceae bacterium]|nr:response regulator [Bacteriovoracaceae bacterium]
MKILIVEDEPLIARSLKKLLEKKGCLVTWEPTGNKAIEIIKSESFDRIICDLMLQDVSGFDVIEDSKERYSISEIGQKFIIITAYSSPQVLQRAALYGCSVLSKPFEDLNEAIDVFIRGRDLGTNKETIKS